MNKVYFKVYEDAVHMEYDNTPAFSGVVDTEDMYVVGVNEEPLRYFNKDGEKVLLLSQVFDKIPSWIDETTIGFEIINKCADHKYGIKTMNMGGYYLTVQTDEIITHQPLINYLIEKDIAICGFEYHNQAVVRIANADAIDIKVDTDADVTVPSKTLLNCYQSIVEIHDRFDSHIDDDVVVLKNVVAVIKLLNSNNRVKTSTGDSIVIPLIVPTPTKRNDVLFEFFGNDLWDKNRDLICEVRKFLENEILRRME